MYNKARSLQPKVTESNEDEESPQNTAFAELLSSIQNTLVSEDKTPVFQLSKLIQLYTYRVQTLDASSPPPTIHSTQFKNKILSYFPQLEAYKGGRDVLLAPSGTAGKSIRKMCVLDGESESVILSRASDILRKAALKHKCPEFNGNFSPQCQQEAVSKKLITFLSMVLYGCNIEDDRNYMTQYALTLAQLLVFN